MGYEIRLPNITGSNTTEQLAQVKSYLYQTVEQLNYALDGIKNDSEIAVKKIISESGGSKSPEQVQQSFNDIKALIIKSADIVNAYYETISDRLEGEFVAESDFANYQQVVSQDITESAERVERIFHNLQVISSKVDNIGSAVIDVEANIITGHLYDDDNGIPIHGVQIGQTIEVDGEKKFNQFARFVANRLSFFDANESEVAYISDYKLYITNVEITGNLQQGGYMIDSTNGLAWKWVGRR